jgi:hypothetical protein
MEHRAQNKKGRLVELRDSYVSGTKEWIFIENETTSDYITKFFPERLKFLAEARPKYTPIDEVLSQPQTNGDTVLEGQTGLELANAQSPRDMAQQAHALPTASITSLARLFPATSEDAEMESYIATWRQFVDFSPTNASF